MASTSLLFSYSSLHAYFWLVFLCIPRALLPLPVYSYSLLYAHLLSPCALLALPSPPSLNSYLMFSISIRRGASSQTLRSNVTYSLLTSHLYALSRAQPERNCCFRALTLHRALRPSHLCCTGISPILHHLASMRHNPICTCGLGRQAQDGHARLCAPTVPSRSRTFPRRAMRT
jgi:hypothetical protein